MLHIFNFFGQFCPIIGAILADSYLGNTRTISWFYYVYAVGWIFLIITSLPTIGISIYFLVSLSLLLISIGNGSVRACITSLGALQFKIPQQSHLLTEYFSLYYFVYYFGIFLSKILPPMVRANTTCFNVNGCYPAVFGTLAASFLASWIFFTIGKIYYKPEKLSDENILVKFYGCIKVALVKKWKTGSSPKAHWLHHAIGRYDESFVYDVSKVIKISKLFIPLPIYFALLAQQDSSWTFQASQMNTTIWGVTLQADQAKAMGPVLLFIFIPLWQYILGPILKHFDLEMNPLQSVTLGGVCSAFAFVAAGVLQETIYTEPYKSISIAWQVPQFALLMMGELFLSIPGLHFAFTQAPLSMKSVVTAAWFLNNAFGNLLVVIITELDILQSQSAGYFFYGVLMIVCTIVFGLLAYDYLLDDRAQWEDDLRGSNTTAASNQLATNLSSDSLVNENM
ncbi:solute carrier family 15 member 1 isoform X2 [Episyrphus balteatus]|nr:solute carrier family 15 member 1 isoform X2 [Episyrphus balteatus]